LKSNLNATDYIATGLLESYVLGLTSSSETAEVEQYARQYPEIEAEIAALRAALEEYALTFEQAPPAALREQVLAALKNLDEPAEESETGGREIALPVTPPTMSIHRTAQFSWLMAASWAFLALSLLGNLLFYARWRSSEDRLSLAEAQNNTLAQRVDVQQARYSEELTALQDPATRKIDLKGTPDLPNARAVVYWNAPSRKVYLASGQLPAAPTGKQYQLWAIVGGKPVDAGVFNLENGLLRLKNMGAAQAFAISLEATGGSTTALGPKGPVVLAGEV